LFVFLARGPPERSRRT